MNAAPVIETYRRDGFDYHLVEHHTYRLTGWVLAIYSQGKNGEIWAYEVVKARFRNARTTKQGVTYSDGYKLPGNSAWGIDGWTCFTLEEARKRLARVTEIAEEKENGYRRAA